MNRETETGYFLAIRALGKPFRIRIDKARFEEIELAWMNLKHVVNLEEEWDAVIQNYLDLEKALLDAATRHMILSIYDYHNFQDIRLTFAVKLSNLLSTCRAYLDHTPHHLNALSPKDGEMEKFKELTNGEYENRFGYQFMEALRSYSQHRGLPLHGATYDARKVKNDERGMVRFSVATNILVERLRGDKKFKQAVLKDVTADILEVEPLIRDYIEGLGHIHMKLRNLLKERVEAWKKSVRDAISEYAEASDDGGTLGLCALELAERNEWVRHMPLVEQMLERVEILQKRNGSLQNLTRRFVTGAPRPTPKD